MAQPKPVGITLDRPRRLLFRIADLRELERALGNESIEAALAARGVWRLSTFFLYGLRIEDRSVSVEKVDKMLDAAIASGKSYIDLWNVVSEALVASQIIRRPLGEDALELEALPSGEPEDPTRGPTLVTGPARVERGGD